MHRCNQHRHTRAVGQKALYMSNYVETNSAKGREQVLKLISDALERAHEDKFPDFAEDAMRLLEEIEARCVARRQRELVFYDADEHDAFMEGAQ